MPDTNKTIEMQGPAGHVVIPVAERQDYLQRGYKDIEVKATKPKVTTKKVRS